MFFRNFESTTVSEYRVLSQTLEHSGNLFDGLDGLSVIHVS